jgi:hypothetical protein
MILAPNEMKAEPDERKSAKVCLETIQLDPELYRIGHTKARSKLENFESNRQSNPFTRTLHYLFDGISRSLF